MVCVSSISSSVPVCPGIFGQVAELAGEAGLVRGASVFQRDEGLVHRAVVAAVEDEDLRPAGDGAGGAQREAVGVAGGGRDLP